MSFFRAFWRIIRLFFWSVKICINSKIKDDKHTQEDIYNASLHTRLWARGCLDIIGMKLKIHGNEEQFAGGLLVSNHQGFMDIVVHASVYNLRFAPNVDIKKMPLISTLVSKNAPIWIDRKNRLKAAEIAEEIQWTMNNKIPIVVYPEGTTTDGVSELLPFKSTPFESVLKSKLPIQPIITKYSSSSKDPSALCWYGDAGLMSTIFRILSLKKMSVDVFILPMVIPEDGDNRRTLSEKVYKMMNDDFLERRANG